MIRFAGQLYLLVFLCCGALGSFAQAATNGQTQAATPPAAAQAPAPTAAPTPPPATLDSIQKQINTLQSDLTKQDSDFAVTLGIGSLVVNSGVTDYSNTANILQANNLGRATPQYLAGVSMRMAIHNFRPFNCKDKTAPVNCKGKPAPVNCKDKTAPGSCCEVWRQRPWEGFVSIKFAPQSSQTINGYVIGGSYAIAHYLDVLIGYALTPVNEPSPGFRIAAAQYVTQQQQLGLDLNFNPTAMLNNAQNAFDGFPITDSNGKLIYTANPLEIHYRGGAVFGVSIPFTFSSVFTPKSQ